MGIAIVADALSKTYRTYRKQEGLRGALKGLFLKAVLMKYQRPKTSFQIEEGEFVGFLGPNGAGKTAVLKMLADVWCRHPGSRSRARLRPWERKVPLRRQFSLVLGQEFTPRWDLPARESGT